MGRLRGYSRTNQTKLYNPGSANMDTLLVCTFQPYGICPTQRECWKAQRCLRNNLAIDQASELASAKSALAEQKRINEGIRAVLEKLNAAVIDDHMRRRVPVVHTALWQEVQAALSTPPTAEHAIHQAEVLRAELSAATAREMRLREALEKIRDKPIPRHDASEDVMWMLMIRATARDALVTALTPPTAGASDDQ